MSTTLRLGTTITRTDADGDAVECEAVISFTVESYSPGCPAVMYQASGDPGWPAEAVDYEFRFDGAELECEPDEAPGPLTDAELLTLRSWFASHHAEACEAANDNFAFGPDPDAARDWAFDDHDGDRL